MKHDLLTGIQWTESPSLVPRPSISPSLPAFPLPPVTLHPRPTSSLLLHPSLPVTQRDMAALKVGGDLNSDAGMKNVNNFLESRSFVEGWTISQSDAVLAAAILKAPDAGKFPHARRWYNNVTSYSAEEKKKLPGVGKTLSDFGATANGGAGKSAAGDDDDMDLFGSDEDEEAEAAKAARVAAYNEKKAKKPALVAKSNVILDVKPWDDETDMKLLEESVRKITCEGMVWGVSKLVPLAYGIKKLQIVCVVEDDKVSIDWLQEAICENEDYVQSCDVAAFQKI